ncbi:MAG: transglutaminase domain-containing protein [Candidatus Hydrogenedentes bacterium]|nr:transglutaminase domain-containing protein [Candidatus Hydrogenedentota bacterium]
MLWPRKRIAIALVVVLWAVMTGSLLYREVLEPAFFRAPPPPGALAAQDAWMGIYMGGDRRVGYMNTVVTPGFRDGEAGAAMHLNMRMELNLFNFPASLVVKAETWTSAETGLKDFTLSLRSGDQNLEIEGALGDGKLTAQLHTGGDTIPLSFPIDQDLLLSGGMGMPSAQLPVMEVGETQYIDAFDPMSMSVGRTKLDCIEILPFASGDQEILARVIAIDANGLKSKAWIGPSGEVLQAQTPFGLTLRVLTAQEALAPFQESENADLIQALAIRPTGATPIQNAKRMTLRFHGVDTNALPEPGPFLLLFDGRYTARQATSADVDGTATLDPAALNAILADDPLDAAHNPKITRAAAGIVEGALTPWDKALRIYTWVYENVEKRPALGVPTAVEVLQNLEGDCNEHTVLFTALARAAGLPARIAIGLVWSDEIQGFGYHAWPEVFMGKWIPMDPTLGQVFADATHIKLLNGNIDRWVQLIPFVGQLQIEVLEVE